ncbi:MAG TPA: TatD family hydrolase [Longimicrobiales bacterium]|nr:TatD family hydrolase [Longimicrobiales bacterium]
MFDSHCHLTDDRFARDVDDVIARAWDAGLTGIVTVASDADDAVAALALAGREPRIHATAGVHPHVAAQATDGDLARIRDMIEAGAAVAIGETGLDFHYDNSPRDTQRRLFDWHLQLAADSGLPVVVHSRSADADTAAALRAAAGVRGVLHCFAGARALFDAALDVDWYISFAGLVTFRNFDNDALLRAVPGDRLLVETDSPYLAPVPHRGHRNEPAFVVETCRTVAALRGEDVAATARSTTANAVRFYGLAGP